MVDPKEDILKKLEYIGLDLRKIPAQLKKYEPLEFRIPKFYDEKQYRQYRYVTLKDIEILLTPTNRLDDIQEKYKNASPLSEYLDSKKEENISKYTTFLNMLKNVEIDEIKKTEEEQEKLNNEIPFKVKFEGNYLWQIYYSENTDKYFMLVPTEDTDYSTFFYLLKRKLERGRSGRIFVPIRNVGYSTAYLKKSEFEDIENYLWLFTKEWPLLYEVYDKKDNLSIQISGETQVFEKIKSPYKIELQDKEEAKNFYKLLKAMFILQTDLPNYFKFETSIGKLGEIEFYNKESKMEFGKIAKWINEEYELGLQKNSDTNELIKNNLKKLSDMKIEVATQEIEYLAKEKQISTFLDCKKSFFGKFKYFFKYSKKKTKANIKSIKTKREETAAVMTEEKQTKKRKKVILNKKENYTIEELIELYKEFEKNENELKNVIMDLNALKLKNKNMKKKIENASLFIEEIDNHKKSIFEFWRYSNKDEVAVLPEGEAEEINVVKKIEKIFEYEDDMEKLGKTMDRLQRKKLSKEETDSIYIANTNVLEILNKVKNSNIVPKEITANLKELKIEAIDEKSLTQKDEFDIFGGIAQDSTKISMINNKRHRELPKDKYNILEINKNTKQLGYKLILENTLENINKALDKIVISEDFPIYKMVDKEKAEENDLNIFDINSENEVEEKLKEYTDTVNLYKINMKKGTNAINYTNCIFYDNQNQTLPIGQDLSSKILVDLSKLNLVIKEEKTFKIIDLKKNDDFSKINIKKINVIEYDIEGKK